MTSSASQKAGIREAKDYIGLEGDRTADISPDCIAKLIVQERIRKDDGQERREHAP
jgi:hypothetical protein